MRNKTSVKVFGRNPSQQVTVKFETVSDPMKLMEDGMDEFIYKSKMINYGK